MDLLAKKNKRIQELLKTLPHSKDTGWEFLTTEDQTSLAYIRAKLQTAKRLTYWEYRDLEDLYDKLKSKGWQL
jgi:hypothetical protein